MSWPLGSGRKNYFKRKLGEGKRETTLHIYSDMRDELESLKLDPDESYKSVIDRLIVKARKWDALVAKYKTEQNQNGKPEETSKEN